MSDEVGIPAAKRRKEAPKKPERHEPEPLEQEGGPQYRIGSIVRLTMKNFVTYSHAEIRPGAQLNVVIGPNGTGKSTLVCAIVLGLGGKPATLGRAKEPRDFIKIGCDMAIIDCELYGGPTGKNYRVARTIYEDSTSSWKINGQDSNQKAVLELVQKLNIQVDNLCQFLPQDRVSAFAAMSPTELLHETELAIHAELNEQHSELMKLKKEETTSRINYETQVKVLDDLKRQNEALRRDVQRFQERERLMKHLELLESKRPWVAFEASRHEALALQAEATKIQQELEQAEATIAPLQLEAETRRTEAQAGAEEEQTAMTRTRTLITMRQQAIERVKALQAKTQNFEAKIQSLTETENRRVAQLENAKKHAAELRNQINDTEAREAKRLEDIERFTALAEKLRVSETAELARIKESQEKMKPLNEESQNLERIARELSTIYKNVTNTVHAEAKNSMLLYNFVRSPEAKAKLKAPVLGPMCLFMKVANKQHAAWINHMVPYNVFTGFVCESDADRQVLVDYARDHNFTLPSVFYSPHALTDLERPYRKKELKEVYGMDGYMIDIIDAPPLVKWTLCNFSRLHTVPFANDNNSLTNQHMKAFQAQARNTSCVRQFTTPSSFYRLQPSRHSDNVMIAADPIKLAYRWVFPTPPLNNMTHDQLNDRLQIVKQELDALGAEVTKSKGDLGHIKQEIAQAQNALKAAQRSDVSTLKARLREQEAQVQDLSKDSASAKIEYERSLVATLQERIQPLLQLHKATQDWVEANTHSAQLLLRRGFLKSLAAKADEALAVARAANQEVQQRLDAANRAFLESKERTRVLRTEAKKKADRTPELETAWAQLPETLEELDTEIDNHRVRISAITHNPAIIEKFQQREAEIAKLSDELENHNTMLQEKQARIVTLKNRWLPKVEEFVQEIDANFAQFYKEIGCVGNVKLSAEGDDFEKYSIDIWVSYRQSESPRKLDARVQSGGERSVATMLYLIALQKLSDCPFRLVDEINQGMDPHNERMIFDQVTAQASKPNTPQYFLITPKLLPDLKFTPAITVLCVFNGPYMVDQKDWFVSQNPM